MLNLFQHLLKFRRLRVTPAMTGALQKGFLEVPLSGMHDSYLKTCYMTTKMNNHKINNMQTVIISKQEKVKQQLSDIIMDISWAKISQKYFGKSSSWMYHKLDGVDGNGNKSDFTYSEKLQLKNALLDFSERVRKAAETIEI